MQSPSAFPNDGQWANGHPESGMSLREYFAASCDVSVYAPKETFERNYGRPPTVEELANHVADIRMAEADIMMRKFREPTGG